MFESEYCKVSYVKKNNAVLCQWKKFCKGDDYRQPLEHGLKLLEQHQAQTWITDTTNGFESGPADTKWLVAEFIPQTITSSCKNIIFILADDSPLKGEIELHKEALAQFFKVDIVANLDLSLD